MANFNLINTSKLVKLRANKNIKFKRHVYKKIKNKIKKQIKYLRLLHLF